MRLFNKHIIMEQVITMVTPKYNDEKGDTRFIEDGIVKATAQFGDNYNLETGRFNNGAKVTITYKPKDSSRIADTIEVYCSCCLPETVAHVKLEDGLGTEWDWQIYCQDEEVPGAND